MLSELAAAFLWAQMQDADAITMRRLDIWSRYQQAFEGLEVDGAARRPVVPEADAHNAHMYYLLLSSLEARTQFIAQLQESGIQAVFHYVPLHSSPMGQKGWTGCR